MYKSEFKATDEEAIKYLMDLAEKRDLYIGVTQVEESEVASFIEPGTYLIFGSNKNKIEGLLSSHNRNTLFPEERLKQLENPNCFPQATMIKFEHTLACVMDILSKIYVVEFMCKLFETHGLQVPKVIDRRDWLTLYRVYNRVEEGDFANPSAVDLRHFLNVVASDLTLEEYEKKNKESRAEGRLSNFFSKKELKIADKLSKRIAGHTAYYKPTSENCISPEEMLERPERKSKVNVAHGENGMIIEKIDKELGKWKDIKWSLNEDSPLSLYGTDEYTHWHSLTFPTKYEQKVFSIVTRAEFDLDGDRVRSNFVRNYIKGAKLNVTPLAVPYDFFNVFMEEAARVGLEYYFDNQSTYGKQTADTVIICVEDDMNREIMEGTASALGIAYAKTGSFIGRNLEKMWIEKKKKREQFL